jgi:hypothetical protein
MSGWVNVVAPCFACGRPFSFNPHRVPSIPIGPDGKVSATGDRKPICSTCIVVVNERRKAAGLPEWPVYPDSYDAIPESEL